MFKQLKISCKIGDFWFKCGKDLEKAERNLENIKKLKDNKKMSIMLIF